MFANKGKYKNLATEVKIHGDTLFGGLRGTIGIIQELNSKADQLDVDRANYRLQSRIDELEELLIKAEILVEVKEAKADLIREEPDLNSLLHPLKTKKVRYAVKKVK